MRLHQTATMLLATAGLIGVAAPAAMAYDLETGTAKTAGRAQWNGQSILINNGHQVHIYGTINDVCPGDGYGALVRVTIRLNNDAEIVKTFRDTSPDCTGPGTEVDITTRSYKSGVKSGGEQVFELDHDTGKYGDITSFHSYTWGHV
jgi:hypothetical protein